MMVQECNLKSFSEYKSQDDLDVDQFKKTHSLKKFITNSQYSKVYLGEIDEKDDEIDEDIIEEEKDDTKSE